MIKSSRDQLQLNFGKW